MTVKITICGREVREGCPPGVCVDLCFAILHITGYVVGAPRPEPHFDKVRRAFHCVPATTRLIEGGSVATGQRCSNTTACVAVDIGITIGLHSGAAAKLISTTTRVGWLRDTRTLPSCARSASSNRLLCAGSPGWAPCCSHPQQCRLRPGWASRRQPPRQQAKS